MVTIFGLRRNIPFPMVLMQLKQFQGLLEVNNK